ncbi:MAG: ATP-dependent helicase [Candidatus Nomurabacteria bacterium]|jgi:DNA helicase-2/ATP-dependent DNA helicase PcrA|nr:ATP-dependent helicase [Candidatus Nomurabacteria bacterium]
MVIMNFDKEYQKLNPAQRAAVDKTDGTLMVIAGPGTGKTQLLAMRVANILKTTDTDPGNILCLTFTESAAANMTERMAQIFGVDAYKVAVHTFHSFGSEVIGRHPEYFYSGALFRPADELTTLEVLDKILSNLSHDNPLTTTMNGEWTYLNELNRTISDFKKAGLTAREVEQLLTQNLVFSANVTSLLRKVFADKITSASVQIAQELLDLAEKISAETPRLAFSTEPTLAEIFARSLARHLDAAKMAGKTKPLTEWKKTWTTKSSSGDLILKDDKQSQKLLFIANVYAQYEETMQARGFYDFDDMILNVITAVETNPDLRAELQETFQYVLVDEFQDTNDAQMRLLHALTDYDEQPNLMVVGDDDQAIYRFQGADISNIQQFATRFPTLTVISLSENYRSGAAILDLAKDTAAQISERLVGADGSVKKLIKKVSPPAKVRRASTVTREAENDFIAREIQRLIDTGAVPDEIAVIARNHKQLERLLPFLTEQNLSVDYERRRDVLSSEPIQQLINLALVVEAISRGVPAVIDEYLPQVLAHEAWQINAADLWHVSLNAHGKRLNWLDTLSAESKFSPLTTWLKESAQLAQNEPLENTLDKLIGFEPDQNHDKEHFSSPLYSYFFTDDKLQNDPEKYLGFLADLTTLRGKLREWRPDQSLKLVDFLDFIREAKNLNRPIVSNLALASQGRVKLLTAHKAKGLEFDHVFIIGANSEIWGSKTRVRGSLLGLPHNMPFRLAGDNDDERLRLLFVTLTRARHSLTITSSDTDGDRTLLPLEYVLNLQIENLPSPDISIAAQQLATAWHTSLVKTDGNLHALLANRLANYRLSATHLNAFVAINDGGPENFLIRYLLRFPTAQTPQAAFGTAIHTALQRAHTHLTATGSSKPLEDTLGDFASVINGAALSSRDHDFYTKKGIDILTIFMRERAKTFTKEQKAEQHFDAVIDDVRLNGLIDLIDIDKKNKTLIITDYKTGRAPKNWQGTSEYEKIKLHKYRHQLMFYKLLIENSREFSGWTIEKGVLEFVEPAADGQLVKLELDFNREEMAEFTELVKKVWARIQALDLPSIDNFTPNLAGMIGFEQFLMEKK